MTDTDQPLTCAAARALIERFAETTLSAEDSSAMRAHIVSCADCARAYRETIESVGRTAAAAREVRDRDAEAEARERRIREAVEGQIEPPRHRNLRLRTMLLPAFFALLMIQVVRAQKPRPAFVVEGAIGEVEITGRPIASYGDNEIVMRRGARCITAENSSARIEHPECTLSVGESTEIWIVSIDPARARLHVGSLNLEGRGEVETTLGIVSASGANARGRVVLDADGLLIDPTAGTWTFQDADGTKNIPAGERLRL